MALRSLTLSAAAAATASLFHATALASVSNPYIPDAFTLHLWHFEESAGASDPGNPFADSATGSPYSLTDTGGPDGRNNTGAGGYGAPGYAGFGSAFDSLQAGDGTLHTNFSAIGGGASGSTVAQSTLLNETNGAFTWEALINTSGVTGTERAILSHDGDTSRGASFRLDTAGNLSLFVTTGVTATAPIPLVGDHAFAAGEWFHVAVAYTGEQSVSGNLLFYWTRLNSDATEANLIGTATLAAYLSLSVSNVITIGGNSRQQYRHEIGLIDEVRVSSVARGAGDFIFIPEPSSATLLGFGAWFAAARRLRRNS